MYMGNLAPFHTENPHFSFVVNHTEHGKHSSATLTLQETGGIILGHNLSHFTAMIPKSCWCGAHDAD